MARQLYIALINVIGASTKKNFRTPQMHDDIYVFVDDEKTAYQTALKLAYDRYPKQGGFFGHNIRSLDGLSAGDVLTHLLNMDLDPEIVERFVAKSTGVYEGQFMFMCEIGDVFCDQTTDEMCASCGVWVCVKCSVYTDYYNYGKHYLCHPCLEEYDNNSERVQKHLEELAQ